MSKKDNINLAEKFQQKLDSNQFKNIKESQAKDLKFLFDDESINVTNKKPIYKSIGLNSTTPINSKPKHATVWLSTEVINLEEKLKVIYTNKNLKYNRSQMLLIGLLKELENNEL